MSNFSNRITPVRLVHDTHKSLGVSFWYSASKNGPFPKSIVYALFFDRPLSNNSRNPTAGVSVIPFSACSRCDNDRLLQKACNNVFFNALVFICDSISTSYVCFALWFCWICYVLTVIVFIDICSRSGICIRNLFFQWRCMMEDKRNVRSQQTN